MILLCLLFILLCANDSCSSLRRLFKDFHLPRSLSVRFRLFEVRSAFCPRSLLASRARWRKGRFGGNLAQSYSRSFGGSKSYTRSGSFLHLSYKPSLTEGLTGLGSVLQIGIPYAAWSSLCSLCMGFTAMRRLFFGTAWIVAGVLCSLLCSALPCELASYSVPSLSMAHMMPDNRRAKATTAIRFPRRCAIPSAHLQSAAVFGFFSRIIRCAACTSSTLTRVEPALVICPRSCFSPELNSRGTSPM